LENFLRCLSAIAFRKNEVTQMKRKILLSMMLVLLASLAAVPVLAEQGGRAGSSGAVYVISQGLYYDTFVAVDPLPFKGRFQKIENGMTQYGPGDPGYLGGRWWEDKNGNGYQDEGDHFFLCPLLGPGRETK
jgi:opacity protein-like surface antigen